MSNHPIINSILLEEYNHTVFNYVVERIIKDNDIDSLSFVTLTAHGNVFNFNFITIKAVVNALNLTHSKNPQDWMVLVQGC